MDPLMHIYRFADEKKMSKKLHTLSLGQDQSQIALNMIRNAIDNGAWIVLQNCHYALTFLTEELEQICSDVFYLNPYSFLAQLLMIKSLFFSK
jgi:dynein heavy chain